VTLFILWHLKRKGRKASLTFRHAHYEATATGENVVLW